LADKNEAAEICLPKRKVVVATTDFGPQQAVLTRLSHLEGIFD
jgi:hypothetical protein